MRYHGGAMDFTDAQIRAIRRRYAAGGVTQRELAKELDVSERWIIAVLRGRLRKEAGGPIHRVKKVRSLTKKQVEKLRTQYARGKIAQVEIAKKIGLDIAGVSRMLRGITYADAGGPLAETNGNMPTPHKLTHEQLEELLASPESHSVAARRLGVSRQAVQQLRDRWGWSARWG